MNDAVEEGLKDLSLLEYIETIWLEITCVEAQFMCSRYDTVTGEHLSIEDRVGFVDRKLQRISKEIDNSQEWFKLAKKAYQASYGYEYQGDSLLLARENLLYTFMDYYMDKFQSKPSQFPNFRTPVYIFYLDWMKIQANQRFTLDKPATKKWYWHIHPIS